MACLFCTIAAGQQSADRVFENDHVLVIKDIAPIAPIHWLIIPKQHVVNVDALTDEQLPIMATLCQAAQGLARQHSIADDGYRLIINCNAHGGQTVDHLHMHLLAGKALKWPSL